MNQMRIWFLFILLCCQCLSASNSQWKWRKFSTEQYLLLPVLLGGSIVSATLGPPDSAQWKGGILLDDTLRDGLVFSDKQARITWDGVGDVVLFSLVLSPFLIDGVGNLLISDGDGIAAREMALVNAQSVLLVTLLSFSIKNIVARERPFQRECGEDPNYDDQCNQEDTRRSFYSGHSAFAFVGAGLLCRSRQHLDLWGGQAGCLVGIGLATLTAASRVFADKHYFSDVLVGAALGWGAGYLLPKWLHYQHETKSVVISPWLQRDRIGIWVSTSF